MNKHWQNRFLDISNGEFKKIDNLQQSIEEQFSVAALEIENKLNILFDRYAKINNLSIADAKMVYPKTELKRLKKELGNIPKIALDPNFQKQLDNFHILNRVSILKAHQMQIQAIIEELYANVEKHMLDNLGESYSNVYYQNIYNLQRYAGVGTAFTRLNENTIEQVLMKPWKYGYFSKNWLDSKNDLITELTDAMTKVFFYGQTRDEAIKAFQKRMDVSKFRASRIILTEHANICGQASFDSYKETDIEQYQFVATLDLRTSDTCRALDGEVVNVKDREVGINYPPLHPFCRSTTIPYLEGVNEMMKRVASDTEGNVYEIPATMNYDEWYKKYVANDPKSLAEEKKIKNKSSDKKQYEKYKEVLGKEAPKTFTEFQELKYNNSNDWSKLKEDFKIVNSYKIDFGYMSPKRILELDRLAFEVKRKNQISRYKKQGNFAVLQYNDKIKFASSRISNINDKEYIKYLGDKNQLVLLKEKRVFKTKNIGENVDNKTNTVPRYFDTEAKFFEFLNDRINNEDIKEIFMLSEKSMCESCRGVAEQFIKKYPKVKVNVVSSKTLDGWKDR